MKPFRYLRASSVEEATVWLTLHPNAKLLAGGTNLVDLMREGVEGPDYVIDINRLPLATIEQLPDGGVRIGALARNSDMANHPLVRNGYPLLAKALLSGASPQLRNMATAAGNLMQRTRCPYFMDTGFPACNKRAPGSGCAALNGEHRTHAIFGETEQCIAVHPSDMCVALAALDAVVQVRSHRHARAIPISEFHRLPGTQPQMETALRSGEMILSIDLPPSPFGNRTEYIKVRDRRSFAFALVACAATLHMEGDKILDARLALGGVAAKPWRLNEVEKRLAGNTLTSELLNQASELAISGAHLREGNRYKAQLVRATIQRALSTAGGLA